MSRSSHVFVSPHLDDAALSCWGLISRLSAAGERVVIVTAITADLPTGESLSWLGRRIYLAWGLGNQPFAARRLEDLAAGWTLGADCRHLELLDMVNRRDSDGRPLYEKGYLGVTVHPADWEHFEPFLRDRLRRTILAEAGDELTVYCPLAAGEHVDHVIVRYAVEALAAEGDLETVIYYEDYPYATQSRAVENRLSAVAGGDWKPIVVRLTSAEFDSRVRAIACYTSQVSNLFPSTAERLLEIARACLPLVPWPRTLGADRGNGRARISRSVAAYVAEVGGERYWQHVCTAAGTEA